MHVEIRVSKSMQIFNSNGNILQKGAATVYRG